MGLRAFLVSTPLTTLLRTATAARTTPARLHPAALLLMGRRAIDAISDVVVDDIVFVVVIADYAAGQMRGLYLDMNVALADAEESCAPFVKNLDLDLIQIASEAIERFLDGFLACLRCCLYDLHSTSCLPWPHRVRRGTVRPTMPVPRPGALPMSARKRTARHADIYFRFGRFLSALAISFLRC
jgi:hypothetical protein